VYDRPSIFYGWAEKNTRPKIKSNEKRKRHKVNGLLSVDVISGEEYLQLKSKAKSEDVASYFGNLCDDLSEKGCQKVTIILDNNSTHKDKMKSHLKTLMSALQIKDKIKVEFLYTPPYSPNFNLAEYIIHLLRLRFLHHLPLNVTIEQIKEKLSDYFSSHQLQTPKQIENTIRHICGLVR
ncbi:MAG: transposase, partial [Cyanobacteria bacterium J06555_3]